MFTLTFTEPGVRPRSHPVEDENRGVLVGREPGCDVVLRSNEVSRRHARFYVRAGDLVVEDLGSHNGVVVAGARIERPTPLVGVSELELGDVRVAVGETKRAAKGPAGAPGGVGAGAVLRGRGKEVRLPARALVGRGADCDVVLDDASVSRHHAELARDERGLYRLRDLGSGNGTFLDGRQVGKGPVLVRDGGRLRFGDVELLFWRPPAGAGRRTAVLAAFAALFAIAAAIGVSKQSRPAREIADRAAEPPGAAALAEQARAALDGERFVEAQRLAQIAIDRDPLAQEPRRLLERARREQQAAQALVEASAKSQVGNEDEALRLYAQIPPESRFFPRARIRAKDLAQDLLRDHGAACRSAAADGRFARAADECGRALDLKCQTVQIASDPLLKLLRAAEKRLSRRVAWSCPADLAALFHDGLPGAGEALPAGAEQAMRTMYPDPAVREAISIYLRGDPAQALRALSRARPAAARETAERVRVADGRYREGQTALLAGDVARADRSWGEALRADAALLPAGSESFLGRQMRSALSRAHARLGDERFAKGQYASAHDEWMRGLSAAPEDPPLLDSLARLEKVAEGLLQNADATCDQLQIAARITRADPPSPAHTAAQRALAGCR